MYKRQEEAKEEIARVNREIAALESMVISRSSERTKLQNALRDTDTVIATTNQSIRHSTRSIEMLNRRINNLEAEAVSLERDIVSRQSQLERALGAFYILNQGGDLKILLGDSGAHETERHRAYFDILLREQLAEINAFKAAVSTLDENQKEQEVIRADQEQEQKELKEQQADLLCEQIGLLFFQFLLLLLLISPYYLCLLYTSPSPRD